MYKVKSNSLIKRHNYRRSFHKHIYDPDFWRIAKYFDFNLIIHNVKRIVYHVLRAIGVKEFAV